MPAEEITPLRAAELAESAARIPLVPPPRTRAAVPVYSRKLSTYLEKRVKRDPVSRYGQLIRCKQRREGK